MPLARPQLLIFDLDGTLIDSAVDIGRALNDMLGEIGCAPLSQMEIKGMIGNGAATLVGRALAARPDAKIDPVQAHLRFLELYEIEPAVRTRPYPGVAETLGMLAARDYTLAVCTNKPVRMSRLILEQLALSRYFSRVIGGDSLPFRKPDPRMLTALLEPLDLPPDRALMIGDSEVDAETAHAAGVPFVLMTYGYRRGPVELINHRHAFDFFEDLTDLLRFED